MTGVSGLLSVYSDGASRGNPGPAGIGGRALDERGKVVAEVREYLGEATNNVAEYHGLIRILEEVSTLGFDRVRVFTDSTLMANQITGGFRVKSKDLKPLVGKVLTLLDGFRSVQVEHIPREKNTECDTLANRAIDEGLAGERKPILEREGDSLF